MTKEMFLEENKELIFKDEYIFIALSMNPKSAKGLSEDELKRVAGYIVTDTYSAPKHISEDIKKQLNKIAKDEFDYKEMIYDIPVTDIVEVKVDDNKDEETKSSEETPAEEQEEMKFDTKSSFITPDEDPKKKESPITFDYDKMVIEFNESDTERKLNKTIQNQIAAIDGILNPIIPKGLKHEYAPMATGMIEMNLSKDGKFVASFLIDPNVVHGNGNYIIGVSQNGPIMVPLNNTSVVAKILAGNKGQNYILTEEEVKESVSMLFEDTNIYSYVDMSGNKLKEITQEDYIQLGKNLGSVLVTYMTGCVGSQIPRFRIKSYKNPNDFVLISDSTCKSPLVGMTNLYTNEEIKYFDGNYMMKSAAGQTVTTKIK